jgi:hypothetical protein
MVGPVRAVLRPGDWVRFDAGEHQVVAVAGTSVRLRSTTGMEQVVLASYLMAAPDFMMVDGAAVPEVEPFGLLDSLPEVVLAAARTWERHVVEVETGLPAGAAPGTSPRPEYDPTIRTLAARDQAKATELGVSVRTVQFRRARYVQQGLWGLVDQRAVRTGRRPVGLMPAWSRRSGRSSTPRLMPRRRPGRGWSGEWLRRWRPPRPRSGAAAEQEHLLQAARRVVDGPAHVRLRGDPQADREPPAGCVHAVIRRAAG